MAIWWVARTANARRQVVPLLRIGQPLPHPPIRARVSSIEKELPPNQAAVKHKTRGRDQQTHADQDSGVQGHGPQAFLGDTGVLQVEDQRIFLL